MKKRTFGRIAAAGLAGLTVVPTVAIVANADMSIYYNGDYTDQEAYLAGTAAYFEWETIYQTSFLTAGDFINISGSNSTYKNATYSWGQIQNATSDGLAGIGVDMAAKGFKYFVTNADANNEITRMNKEISDLDAEYNDALKKFNNQIKDYITVYKNNSMYEQKRDVQNWTATWRDAEGNTYKWVTRTADKDGNHNGQGFWMNDQFVSDGDNGTLLGNKVKLPGDITAYKVTYRVKPVVRSVGAVDVRGNIGKKVSIAAGNEIVQLGKGQGTYIIATDPVTGSTGSGSNSNGNSSTGSSSGSTGSVSSRYYIPDGYRYASSRSYYSRTTQTWYPNLAALRAALGDSRATADDMAVPSPAYSSTNCYFDPETGNYCTAAQKNSLYPEAVRVSPSESSTTTNVQNAIYRVNGLYYYTYTSALAAAGNDDTKVSYISSYSSVGNYFSRYNGQFYSTYASAVSGSGGNANYVVIINSTGDTTYYEYMDPYYQYFATGTNTSSKDDLGGSVVTIGNRSGWTNVRSQINKAKSGATLDVSLNGETYIPSAVMTALDGRNVDVNFKLRNGAVVSYNGLDITDTSDVNVNVVYNTKNVPSGLVKKATSVNNSLSTSQISIGSPSLNGDASVTVKFATKRAGCTAKIYRYNEARNSLQLVDKSTVASTGKVTFDGMEQGGDFVIVLFED